VIRKEAGLFCGSFLRKGEVFAYVGLTQNLKDLTVHPLDARREPSALESWIIEVLTAIRKEAGRFFGSFLRQGEVFAFVGSTKKRT